MWLNQLLLAKKRLYTWLQQGNVSLSDRQGSQFTSKTKSHASMQSKQAKAPTTCNGKISRRFNAYNLSIFMCDEWLGCWWEGLCAWLCSSEWGLVKKGEVHNSDTQKCYCHQLIRQDAASDLSYNDKSNNLTTKHVTPSRSQYGTEKRIIKH